MIGTVEEFRYRLEKAMNIRGLRPIDICNSTGISQSTLSQYRSGYSKPKDDRLRLIASVLDVNPAWLMGLDVPMDLTEKSKNQTIISHGVARVPVLGYVAAGIPIEEIEDIMDYEEIPAELLRGGKKYFGLVLRGDSMEPRMYDGDVVIVQKQDDAESGEYVIAAVNGDHATCKRLMKYRDSIALVSLNSKYDPMIFTNEEVQEKPVTILGVVREIRGKMKGM